jgi:hypothetical protein
MRIISRLIAFVRGHQLMRQLSSIERCVAAMPAAGRVKLDALIKLEIARAAECEFPHMYCTSAEHRYLMWGQGTDIGFARFQSDNQEVRLRGIALWFAVAMHETRESPYPLFEPHYRQLMRMLRELKQASARGNAVQEWMGSRAA